jgi:hypothetical protein
MRVRKLLCLIALAVALCFALSGCIGSLLDVLAEGAASSVSAEPPAPAPEETTQSDETEPSTAEDNWATLYAVHLQSLGFETREFTLFDAVSTYPVYYADDGTLLAILDVSFYNIPGFDYPVMTITDMIENQLYEGHLDSTPAEVPYLIKDGVVTADMTAEEHELVFDTFEESGMSFVVGDIVSRYALPSVLLGAQGRDKVEANLGYLYGWLGEQAVKPAPAAASDVPDGLYGYWYAEINDGSGAFIEAAFNDAGDYMFAAGWLDSEYASYLVGAYTVSGDEIITFGTDQWTGETSNDTFTFKLDGDSLLLGYEGGVPQVLERAAPDYELPIRLD